MASEAFQTWRNDVEKRYAVFKPSPVESRATDGVFYVTSELDTRRAQPEQRTVEAVLSSTNPVARYDYDQVLQHTAEAVDLHRLVDGGLPLLFSHDSNQIIGRAENFRLFEGKLRARLRLSKSTKGEEVWQDIVDGIHSGISIGFNISKWEYDESGTLMTVTRWTPLEASIVAIPADITARIERSLELGLLNTRPSLEIRALELQSNLGARFEALEKFCPEAIEHLSGELAGLERRIMAVTTEADADACGTLIMDIMNRDIEHEEETKPQICGINRSASIGNWSKPMEQEFSLCRALAMQFDPAAARLGGPELEIMQDAARRAGKRASGDQYTLPESVIFNRAVTKGGSGGNLIGVEHMGANFIEPLRARLITGRMGAMILTGLTGDLQIPKNLTDSVAGWIAGDGSDGVGASDPTFDKITMAPKTVGVKSTLSRKMILQGDPASEMILRNTLAYAVAKAIDSAALIGDGTGNLPVGVLETADIGTDTYAFGGLPGFGDIVDMEGALMVDDADVGALGYVTTGLLASKLKQTEVVATTGTMIWTSTAEAEGRMNGYRAIASNITPAGHVLFGNWADLVIGMWSGYDFTVDPYTRAAYGDVIINLLLDCDVAVRHGESFAELHEAPV